MMGRLDKKVRLMVDCDFLGSNEIPSEVSYSRMITLISESNVIEIVQEGLIRQTISEGLSPMKQ